MDARARLLALSDALEAACDGPWSGHHDRAAYLYARQAIRAVDEGSITALDALTRATVSAQVAAAAPALPALRGIPNACARIGA